MDVTYIRQLRGIKEPLPPEPPKQPAEILLIRHGETKLNAEGTDQDRIKGWDDLPIDEEGVAEAHALATKLKGANLDGLVASDMKRTQETARIISDDTGIPVLETTGEFRPWNVGVLSGRLYTEVNPILERMVRNAPNIPIEGGESFYDFKERNLTGLDRIRTDYAGQRIGLITHSKGDRVTAASEATPNGLSDHDTSSDEFFADGLGPGEFREVGIGISHAAKAPQQPEKLGGFISELLSEVKKGNDLLARLLSKEVAEIKQEKMEFPAIIKTEVTNYPTSAPQKDLEPRLKDIVQAIKDIPQERESTDPKKVYLVDENGNPFDIASLVPKEKPNSLIQRFSKGGHGGEDTEELVGTGDGTTTAFTLSWTPSKVAWLHLYKGGALQSSLVGDFTLSGKTVTFALPPGNGEVIIARKRVP